MNKVLSFKIKLKLYLQVFCALIKPYAITSTQKFKR